MTLKARIIMSVASLLLIGMFFLPLWSITLEAPQYPEGIGMRIYLHTIEGAEPNDLDNLNSLNHYIGMKRIEPESFSELAFMPYIIAGLLLLGLVAAFVGKRYLILIWVGLFAILGRPVW